jgi:hypothetical protein
VEVKSPAVRLGRCRERSEPAPVSAFETSSYRFEWLRDVNGLLKEDAHSPDPPLDTDIVQMPAGPKQGQLLSD